MARFLDNIGLAYFWEKIKAWIPFLSRKTQSIPFGQVDSTSTSTVFTATIDGITELRDGVCCYLKNGVVTSASGWTLDINGLGAKPVYQTMADASRTTTIFNINYTFLFVYNSTRVENGCWDVYYGYNTNDDYRAYLVRTGSSTLPAKFKTYRYRLLFTSSDGNYFVGANADTSTNATSVKTPTSEKIDPFGRIVLYATTSAVAADANFSTSYLYQQNTIPLGYSFNSAGGELVLDYPKPVYIKCAPQTDGSAIIDAETPYVQSLPNTEDGKIYIFLGLAYSATNVELTLEHTVYYYKDGAIRIWANEAIQDDTNFVHKAGAETITGEKTFEANVNLTEGATLNLIYDSQTPDGVYLQATEPNGIKAVSFNGISDDGMVQIKNVYVPTNDTDAANKYYVDEEILDIDEYRVYLACRFGPYGVHQKSLCAFCLTNGGREMMMTSFTETSGTGAKEVITDLEFPIGCKIYYNDIMYDLLPNTSGMANRYYTSFNGVDVRYSAVTGTSISLGNYPSETQSTVYLHVIVEDGYWRPYYKEGATNEIIVDSFHMQSGNFYIYLGKTVRNTGYMIQLEDNNPLYYYDGTQLVDYATWIASQNAPQFTYEYKKFDMQYQEIRSGGLIVYDWASSTLASLSNGTYKVTVQRHAYSSVTWPSVLHMTLRYGGDNSWVGISASTSIIPAAIQTQDAYDPLGAITVVMVGFLTLGDQRNNLQLVQEGVSGLCFGGELPYGGSCIESVVVNDFVLLEKIG